MLIPVVPWNGRDNLDALLDDASGCHPAAMPPSLHDEFCLALGEYIVLMWADAQNDELDELRQALLRHPLAIVDGYRDALKGILPKKEVI